MQTSNKSIHQALPRLIDRFTNMMEANMHTVSNKLLEVRPACSLPPVSTHNSVFPRRVRNWQLHGIHYKGLLCSQWKHQEEVTACSQEWCWKNMCARYAGCLWFCALTCVIGLVERLAISIGNYTQLGKAGSRDERVSPVLNSQRTKRGDAKKNSRTLSALRFPFPPV